MRTLTEANDSLRRDINEAEFGGPGQSNTVKFVRSIPSDLTPEGRRTGKVTKAQFEPIVDQSSQVKWGVVHLYRDDIETIQLESRTTIEGGEDECTTLCIPTVPSYVTPNYFLTWVGDKTMEQVSHFRMVMTEQFMRYLVLMKFRDGKSAKIWKEEWNGRAFNCMEPETCYIVFIKSISFSTPPSTTIPPSTSFPALKHDPFTPPAAPLIELPTCPVCLERMDDTTGLLTILCQHVFHCACLMKWKDSTCPVCRHTNPSSIDSEQEPPFGSGEASLCITCDCTDDLWICLICGNVGCGRYKGGHAKEHWKETAHCYALEIETQYVWDYAGDMWVHRLIRDKGDSSKIIELPIRTRRGPDSDSVNPSNGDNEELKSHNKLDILSIEYTHLLTAQLESQRIYFENLLSKYVDEAATAYSNGASASLSASSAMEKIKALEQANANLESELTEERRSHDRERHRADKSADLVRTLRKNLIEEHHVSEGLLQRVEHLNCSIENMTKQHEILKAENCDLRDTNRDLLFCLSAGEKVREIEADIGSGLVRGEMESGILSLPDSTPEKVKKEKSKSKTKGKGKAK